jgi:hypothetical protein
MCVLVWDSHDKTVEARKNAWNRLIADPDRISYIGTRDWATDNHYGSWCNCRGRLTPGDDAQAMTKFRLGLRLFRT